MYKHILFDWGDTLMVDNPNYSGPMYQWPEIEPCEGASNVLATLSASYECHVATNAADSSEQDIWSAFNRCGLDQFISKVFCFESIGSRKPSPEYFSAIQKALACEKEELLMVGDFWEKDIVGALAFGIDAVWINSELRDRAVSQVRQIAVLSDLVTLLNESN